MFFILLMGLFIGSLYADGPVINEVMSLNNGVVADEDGDFPDWIEIYNPTRSVINLEGYGLSDDPGFRQKWLFPEMNVFPGHFVLVYASDKDRRVWNNYFWETIIDEGDDWRYRVGTSTPPADWYAVDFDDSGWLTGPSGFGHLDGDDATVVPSTMSVTIRKRFTIEDTSAIASALLHVDYDDAFVAYLNGVEVARANIGEPGTPPAYDADADNWHEARMYSGGEPEVFALDEAEKLWRQGENVLAIQVNNFEDPASDMTLIPFLTLGFDTPPDNPQGVPEILPLGETFLHANFKIKSEGETISISDPTGIPLDSVFTGVIESNISKGRHPDGGEEWLFYDVPTPGAANETPGYTGRSAPPSFSQPAGLYNGPVEVSFSAVNEGAVIRYTLDGSAPTDSSDIFSENLVIAATTPVRARVYETGLLPSPVRTQTYMIDTDHILPVISLTTTPANLWDYHSGIYTMGPDASSSNPYFGANFWKDWERPVHMELFETDGTKAFSLDAGMKIHGGWPKAYAQKSVAIFARSEYGAGEINYPVFPDKNIETFESIVLRNAGNDWKYTLFRDAMIQSLLRDCNLDLQAYRPAVVYLNGAYWGIHNIREKINEHYVASNYHIDADSIDLMEINLQEPAAFAFHGDAENYNNLIDFVAQNDLSDDTNFRYVAGKIDVDSYIDYHVAQIYMDNKDWPGNNNKFWRPKREGGKWRWIMFDLDYGFGLYNSSAYASNTLAWATDPDGEGGNDSHNLPFTTFLFRNMLLNTSFQNALINRFADYLNTIFIPEVVKSKIAELKAGIEPEMQEHYDKWGSGDFDWGSSMGWSYFGKWDSNIDRMITFAERRPDYLRDHIIDHFELSGDALVSLDVSPEGAGQVIVNTINPDAYPWSGHYFKDVPVELTALPAAGHRFVRWEGLMDKQSQSISVMLNEDLTIQAVFEADTGTEESIVINEINYNSEGDFGTGDWFELYNFNASAIDLSGWLFRDSNDENLFIIPQGTILEADDYLVLSHDSTDFKSFFPSVRFTGDFNFNLSNSGDMLRLYNPGGVLVDSLVYDDGPPWPEEADGLGPTLELKNPALDNTVPGNWMASSGHGSPGKKNGTFVNIDPAEQQVPGEFRVLSNYPNPFNSTTTFAFQLSQHSRVKITIYNTAGQLIEAVVDQRMEPGEHHIRWNADSNYSGIYFYKIDAQGSVKTGKCLLIK